MRERGEDRFEVDEQETESDEVLQQVFDEIGINLAGELANTPMAGAPASAQKSKAAAAPMPMMVQSSAVSSSTPSNGGGSNNNNDNDSSNNDDDSLLARLDALKKR